MAGEWRALFDGHGTQGWEHIGDGAVVLRDGLLETRGGMGLLWYSAWELGDFELEVTWRVSKPGDNSGVFVRFPDPGGDPWDPVRRGYEIQILDDAAQPERRTGAIYGFAGPSRVLSGPAGEWNLLRLTVVGQDYAVWVNGGEAIRFTGDRSSRGFVGLQNHDEASRVQFRLVRAREIEAPR